jgi:hypothetical protein
VATTQKLQRRRHFQKHLELIDLRLILRGRDVKLDEAATVSSPVRVANAQVRRLAADRRMPLAWRRTL